MIGLGFQDGRFKEFEEKTKKRDPEKIQERLQLMKPCTTDTNT